MYVGLSLLCSTSLIPRPHLLHLVEKWVSKLYTVDREIFTVKIIRDLNFRIKNVSSLDGSAM